MISDGGMLWYTIQKRPRIVPMDWLRLEILCNSEIRDTSGLSNISSSSNVTLTSNYASFNWTSSQIDLVNNTLPAWTTAVSYSVWVYPTQWTYAEDGKIIDCRWWWQQVTMWQSTSWFFVVSWGISLNYAVPSLNKWYHLCLTVSWTSINFYLNGLLVLSWTWTSLNMTMTDGKIWQERDNAAPRYWQGGMKKIRIYNRLLTLEDIQRLYRDI